MKKKLGTVALWFSSLVAGIFAHKKQVEKIREEELKRRIEIMEADKQKMSKMYQDGFDSGITCSIMALRDLGQPEEFIKEALLKIGMSGEEAEKYMKDTYIVAKIERRTWN